MAILAPCAAALIAIASPSPDAPPVMRITLSFSSYSRSALPFGRSGSAPLGGLVQLNRREVSRLRRHKNCAIPELRAGCPPWASAIGPCDNVQHGYFRGPGAAR